MNKITTHQLNCRTMEGNGGLIVNALLFFWYLGNFY